ncbi:MAG: nucleotidyltransferase family protein [Peptostreptococcaceae bacterium]|nr:nucleotidyltransferase family protein [Peptostreptococcaceae bacterium]
MKTAGIIAEYNPFHLGHKYLIDELKVVTDAERVVVVMSGNSVQRGDFAIVDKFARAREAIRGGADLVLELPFCYSSQSAEYFARGGTTILHHLGFVDYLCFGSENNNIDSQWRIANLLYEESEELQNEIKEQMKTGISFPLARQTALEKIYPKEADFSIMNSPNDILAIEYIKSLYRLESNIEPISIQRIGGAYYDPRLEIEVPSATAIRERLMNRSEKSEEVEQIKKATTRTMAEYLLFQRDHHSLASIENYHSDLMSIILREKEKLDEIFEVSEGIDNLLKTKVFEAKNVHELAMEIKSKRYTYTRARRMLMNILVGLTKEDMQKVKLSNDIPYTKILAFNDTGRKMIKEASHQIDLINKPADFKPKNELHEILQKYDEIVGEFFYMKYDYKPYGKKVYNDKMTSPIYVEEDRSDR